MKPLDSRFSSWIRSILIVLWNTPLYSSVPTRCLLLCDIHRFVADKYSCTHYLQASWTICAFWNFCSTKKKKLWIRFVSLLDMRPLIEETVEKISNGLKRAQSPSHLHTVQHWTDALSSRRSGMLEWVRYWVVTTVKLLAHLWELLLEITTLLPNCLVARKCWENQTQLKIQILNRQSGATCSLLWICVNSPQEFGIAWRPQ